MTLSLDTIALIGALAATAAGLGWWLSTQFYRLEKLIHRLLSAHKASQDRQIRYLEKRLFACEVRLFGFGPTVASPPTTTEPVLSHEDIDRDED